MDDRLKESISALMDDESNELELQRLLTHQDRDQLTGIWQRYHLARSLIRNDRNELLEIDISQRVAQWIAQETSGAVLLHQQENQQAKQQVKRQTRHAGNTGRLARVSGFTALAASVVLTAVLLLQSEGLGWLGSASVPVAQNEPELPSMAQAIPQGPKIIWPISEQHARRLNEYLLRHAEHSVAGAKHDVMPLIRVASLYSAGI